MDNDDVISAVESTPTYNRTRQILDEIRNQATGETKKEEKSDDVQGVINFL